MDRLQAMKIFERVVEEGGFAAAARAMDMSPPVVTRMVAELEQHLGTRLPVSYTHLTLPTTPYV